MINIFIKGLNWYTELGQNEIMNATNAVQHFDNLISS